MLSLLLNYHYIKHFMPLLDPSQSYTFSKYFELRFESGELAREFGYTLRRRDIRFSPFEGDLPFLGDLQHRIQDVLPYVALTSESAKREILIAPVVTELIRFTQAELRIEYPLKISNQLQGSLDYLLRMDTTRELLVIEAKRDDIESGFTQLLTELIAIDQWDQAPDTALLVGAVSTGNLWQFGTLDRGAKQFTQGLNAYLVPADLDPLMRILVGVLKGGATYL
jgi:hypothetical protein